MDAQLPPDLPSTSTSASALGAPGRRRNGRLQACEPCRRRKVSCDHAFPVCRRCAVRNSPTRCVYLAPPQNVASDGLNSANASSSNRSRKPTPRRAGTGNAGVDRRRRNAEAPHIASQDGITSRINSPDARALPSETSPGYLGFTSFHQVYQETQNSLSLVQGASILSSMRDHHHHHHTTPNNHNSTAQQQLALSPRTLETCLAVLRRIPGEDVALSLFLKHANPNDGWIRLAARRLLESLHVAFGRELRSRRPADLEDMAHVISANTAQPLAEDNYEDEEDGDLDEAAAPGRGRDEGRGERLSDSERWMASFSGRRMRWEGIGVLFTYWGFAGLADHPHRPELPVADGSGSGEGTPGAGLGFDPRRVTLAYKEAAQLCMELCKGCAPNSLGLYLAYKNAVLESVLSGDAAPTFWRGLGEVVATVTYLGYHALGQGEEQESDRELTTTTTVAAQARRRLVSQIFVIDKVAASFSGRPPLLGRKYMLTPLPLDLSDEALLAGGETLARAVAALDERGWNTEGKFFSTTIVRARRLLAVVKDEIMELALGNPIYASTEALLDLKARAYNLLSELPSALRYRPDDVRDLSVPGPTLYTKVVVQLEHLQNLFFVDRLLVQRGHNHQADLLRISFEMVSTTLIFWTHMDRLSGLHGDFEWLVMAYAAPAGGILCNELLKPTIHLNSVPSVSKSGIIQQLSLLIGFLDWVSPSAPNGDLCRSCKAVIQHVLDQALNGPPVDPSNNSAATADQALDFGLDLGTDMGAFFNFDLLDTFEWLRPDMGASQQGQQVGQHVGEG